MKICSDVPTPFPDIHLVYIGFFLAWLSHWLYCIFQGTNFAFTKFFSIDFTVIFILLFFFLLWISLFVLLFLAFYGGDIWFCWIFLLFLIYCNATKFYFSTIYVESPPILISCIFHLVQNTTINFSSDFFFDPLII